MKTLLIVDGGGMKGYIPTAFLAELEKRTGKSCFDIFDFFAGASIGGIVASLLIKGDRAAQALEFFTVDGPNIFGNELPLDPGGVREARYNPEALETTLKLKLGALRLSQITKPLLVPACEMRSYSPYFFRSQTPECDYDLWQVGRATSAAQTYFPAYAVADRIFWDGGNALNNPTLIAVWDAIRMWPGEKLRVLSLSCGEAHSVFPPEKLINPSGIEAGIETINFALAANDELPHYVLKQQLTEGYYRVVPRNTNNLSINGAAPADLANLDFAAASCITDNSALLDDFISYTTESI